MGYQVEARCLKCGSSFSVECEGGMFYHLLRCDKCGKTKSVAFGELGILHVRYMKGVPSPYGALEEKDDKDTWWGAGLEPITEDEYYSAVEATAGSCRCGGDYCMDAPIRCPDCSSTDIEEGEITSVYD